MSPDFVTQVVVDQPQVVIISSKPSQGAPLSAALSTWGLEVVVKTPSQLTPALLEKAYKLVWILDSTTEELQNHTTSLLPYQNKLSLLVPMVTPITNSGPALDRWYTQTQEQTQLLEFVSSSFKQASIIIGQDVLPTIIQAFPVFQVMTQAVEKHVLLDPNMTLYVQTWDSFCISAARLIITPNQDVYLVQGKKITTTALAKLFQLHFQRLTQNLLTIEAIVATEGKLPLNEVVAQPTATSLEVDEVIREVAVQIVHHQVKTPEVTAPTHSIPQPVRQKPTPPPAEKIHISPAVKTPPSKPVVRPPMARQTTIPKLVIPMITSSFVQLNTKPVVAPKPMASQEQIEEEVVRLFQDYRTEHTVQRVRQVAKTTTKTTKKLVHKKKAFMGGVVFVGLGLLVVSLVFFLFVSTWQLKRSLVATLAQSTHLPSSTALFWARLVTWQVNAYTHVLDPSYFATTMSAAEFTASLPVIQEQMMKLNQLSESVVLEALGRRDGEILKTISEANSTAQSLYEKLSENQAKLKTFPTDDLNQDQQDVLTEYESTLNVAKKTLLPVQQLHPLMGALLGKEGKRTYAVVFQNNQELRPTGGFIQAVGLLTFDQGMLIDSQVFNVYDLDAKNTGAATPPLELTQLLGEKQWYLRDSNWSPDFPTSAKQMSLFIERSTGKKIDGVFGMNLIVARNLLKALGPVELPEYNEIITDKNLAERMEFHSEIQLVPSASQPDYSTLFLNRLLHKMTEVQQDKIPNLLSAIQDSFEQKQLLISFAETGELSTFAALGWTGALLYPSCPIQLSEVPCQVDTIAQVEANVGINKANIYIERQITDTVELSPTLIQHQRQMVFTNTATSNAWPKGAYKTYVRLYVPGTAELKSVAIDGTPLSASQAIVKREQNQLVFSFLVDVPIQKSVTVLVDYSLPVSTTSTPFTYALFNQQQPGIENTKMSIVVKPTPGLKPSLIAPQATLKNQSIIFENFTSPHAFVGVKF